jgi:hypothetical protein
LTPMSTWKRMIQLSRMRCLHQRSLFECRQTLTIPQANTITHPHNSRQTSPRCTTTSFDLTKSTTRRQLLKPNNLNPIPAVITTLNRLKLNTTTHTLLLGGPMSSRLLHTLHPLLHAGPLSTPLKNDYDLVSQDMQQKPKSRRRGVRTSRPLTRLITSKLLTQDELRAHHDSTTA